MWRQLGLLQLVDLQRSPGRALTAFLLGLLLYLGALSGSVPVACASAQAGAKAGVQMESPVADTTTVSGEFHLAGRTDAPELMLSLKRAGAVPTGTYTQQRIPVRAGRFDTWIWLPWGNGAYEAALWQWDSKRKTFLQLQAWRINSTGSPVGDVQAVPTVLWAFDPEREAVEQPARAYSAANGRVMLRLRSKHQQLMITIAKDNVANRYMLPVYNGVAATALWLNRGPGKYDITVWCPSDGNSFTPWAAFSVQNQTTKIYPGIDEAPYWYAAAWQKARSAVEVTGLEAFAGSGSGLTGGRLTLRGHSAYPHLIASVERGSEKALYRVPVAADGSFSADIWLRFGAGVHMVTLWSVPGGTGDLQALVRFAAQSAPGRDIRYTAPSLGVESDHPRIVALANQLVKPGTDARTAALAIHDWVTHHISYDTAKLQAKTLTIADGALTTLQQEKGVCQDFAYLTVALLRAAGLEARLVEGRARGYSAAGGNEWELHAWVEVRVADRWLIMDPTWDAGHLTASGQFVRSPSHTYFDAQPELFYRDHQFTRYEY